MSFNDITVRANGDRVLESWFNTLRTQGAALEGAGGISETQFTVPNNSGAVNVTSLAFAIASVRGSIIEYSVYRTTATTELAEFGTIKLVYKTTDASWAIAQDYVGGADVTFSITATGQVQISSSNMSGGTYVGKMRFRARTIAVET